MDLEDFYFAHDGMFVVPIEELTPHGMSQAMAGAVCARRGLSTDWVATFNEAFRRYWERAKALNDKATNTWFPPRKQHVCIARDLFGARPYTQPFEASSWLLYESDFALDTSSMELATYLFFHSERMGLTLNVVPAAVDNVAYFLERTEAELEDFHEGCTRATRPDIGIFRAVAKLLDGADRMYHKQIRPSPEPLSEDDYGTLKSADIQVPKDLQQSFRDLAAGVRQTAQKTAADYFERVGGERDDAAADALCAWLRDAKPRVLVSAKDQSVVWDPDTADETTTLRKMIDGIGKSPAESLRADFEVISGHTTSFLESLANPEALPKPHELDQDATAYIHESRQLIAYMIDHERMHRLKEPSPPYERLMLGARTIHEWGHLAVDAGLVHVADDKQVAFEAAQKRVAGLFNAAIAESNSELRELARKEGAMFGAKTDRDIGAALVAAFMGRMEDYQANVLAREHLSVAEMETYVRANVVPLFREKSGPWMKIARHAYEYQYLCLSRMADPLAYFMDSTWFREHFVEIHVISEERLRAIFEATSAICACYTIDRAAFVQ